MIKKSELFKMEDFELLKRHVDCTARLKVLSYRLQELKCEWDEIIDEDDDIIHELITRGYQELQQLTDLHTVVKEGKITIKLP